ncbi:MAG: hypothetical protein MZU79_01025 [Anaerotruncus sp.]|nr:hypothetical protein [Anaerotruncus sp.]
MIYRTASGSSNVNGITINPHRDKSDLAEHDQGIFQPRRRPRPSPAFRQTWSLK